MNVREVAIAVLNEDAECPLNSPPNSPRFCLTCPPGMVIIPDS